MTKNGSLIENGVDYVGCLEEGEPIMLSIREVHRRVAESMVANILGAADRQWEHHKVRLNMPQGIPSVPYNAHTNAIYGGAINSMILSVAVPHYYDLGFAGFNQAQQDGVFVKKGAKGIPIYIPKFIEREVVVDNQNQIQNESQTLNENVEGGKKKEKILVGFFAKTVFHKSNFDLNNVEDSVKSKYQPFDDRENEKKCVFTNYSRDAKFIDAFLGRIESMGVEVHREGSLVSGKGNVLYVPSEARIIEDPNFQENIERLSYFATLIAMRSMGNAYISKTEDTGLSFKDAAILDHVVASLASIKLLRLMGYMASGGIYQNLAERISHLSPDVLTIKKEEGETKITQGEHFDLFYRALIHEPDRIVNTIAPSPVVKEWNEVVEEYDKKKSMEMEQINGLDVASSESRAPTW